LEESRDPSAIMKTSSFYKASQRPVTFKVAANVLTLVVAMWSSAAASASAAEEGLEIVNYDGSINRGLRFKGDLAPEIDRIRRLAPDGVGCFNGLKIKPRSGCQETVMECGDAFGNKLFCLEECQDKTIDLRPPAYIADRENCPIQPECDQYFRDCIESRCERFVQVNTCPKPVPKITRLEPVAFCSKVATPECYFLVLAAGCTSETKPFHQCVKKICPSDSLVENCNDLRFISTFLNHHAPLRCKPNVERECQADVVDYCNQNVPANCTGCERKVEFVDSRRNITNCRLICNAIPVCSYVPAKTCYDVVQESC